MPRHRSFPRSTEMRGAGAFFLPTLSSETMGYDGPKYTQTPNLFLDEHLPDMGCAETKVVLAVIRQTFGWHKQKDRLSISRLMDLTGLSNRAVIDGTRQAMERGVIDREKSGNSYEYWLVVDGEDTSQPSDEGVNNAHTPCEDTSQEGVNDAHTQKKQKETTQKKDGAREDDADDITEAEELTVDLVMAWRDVRGAPPMTEGIENALHRWAKAGTVTDPDLFADVLRGAVDSTAGRDAGIDLKILRESYENQEDAQKSKYLPSSDPDLDL